MKILIWVYDDLWSLWLGFLMVYEHSDLGLWFYDGFYEHYDYFFGVYRVSPILRVYLYFLGLQHYDFNHAALELTSLMGCRGHGSKSMDPHLLWLNTWNILKLLSVWVLDIPHIEYIEYIYLHKQLVAKATLHFLVLVYLDLVGGLEHVLFFHILGIIIPTDELHHFSEG